MERRKFESCLVHQTMKQTPARTRFKEHFGQANHYLVTSLVALNQLEASNVTEAPPELHTIWNPKDRKASIQRTRLFTLQSILGSAVDAVDMYISLLYRKPNYIRNQALASALDAANRSVQKKVLAVAAHYSVEPSALALLDVLITWRNNVVHELAENTLRAETKAVLQAHKESIAATYRGLVVDQLPAKAEKGDPLTFKETASLINAAHHFVEHVDAKVIQSLDINSLCIGVIQDELDSKSTNGFLAKFNSLPIEKRKRFVKNWLANTFGLVEISDETIGKCSQLQRE